MSALFDVSRWLTDFYLWATLLLAVQLLIGWLVTQPARRIAIAWASTVGLLWLAVLCAVPNWASLHLTATPSPAPAFPMAPLPQHEPAFEQPALSPFAERVELPQPVAPAVPPVAEALVIDWQRVALTGLAVGSASVLLWLALGAWQVRRIRKTAQAAPTELQRLLAELTPAGMATPELGIHPRLMVAVAVGLRHPTILLPQSLLNPPPRSAGEGLGEGPVGVKSTEEASINRSSGRKFAPLRSILAHELAHLRHRDLWLLALMRGLMVLLWVHPLYWLCRRQVRLDQEVLADLAAAELTSRDQYAEQLVSLARTTMEKRVPRLASSVGLWETESQLTHRVALLLNKKLTLLKNCSRRWRIGSLATLLGLAVALSLVTLTPAETEVVKGEVAEVELTASESATDNQDGETKTFTDERRSELHKQLYESREPNIIVGICVDESGQPLAGIEVGIHSLRRDGSGVPQEIGPTVTDESGRFRFEQVVDIEQEFPEGVPEGYIFPPGYVVVTTVASSPGFVPGVRRDVAIEVARVGSVHLLSMVPAEKLTGRIVDEQGNAVEGAQVSSEAHPDIQWATTAADGSFSIDNMAAYSADQAREKDQDTYTLHDAVGVAKHWGQFVRVTHPDFAAKRVRISEIPGHLEVTLSPGATITGKILAQEVDKVPQPVEGVVVTLLGHSSARLQQQAARSDSAGNYRFDSLPPGRYSIHPRTSHWVGQSVTEIEVERREKFRVEDIVMTRGGRVRIQLLDDATGVPLTFEKSTFAYVNARTLPFDDPNFLWANVVEFSPAGVGELQVLPGKTVFLVTLDGRRHSIEYSQLTSTGSWDQLPSHDVNEGKLLEVTARMVQPEPIVEGENHFVPAQSPSETDEQEDSSQPDNRAALILSVPPSETDEPESASQTDSPWILIGPPSETDEPEAAADDADNSSDDTEVGGKPAEQADDSSATSEASEQQPVVGDIPQDHRQLAEPEPNTIVGICVDENGQPLAGVEVEVFSRPLGGSAEDFRKVHATSTNALGEFRLEDVVDVDKVFPKRIPRGGVLPRNMPLFTIVARSPGRAPVLKGDLAHNLARDGRADVLVLDPAEKLTGKVVDEQGQPVAGARVSLPDSGVPPGGLADFHSATTTDAGTFVIDDLRPFTEQQARSEASTTWHLTRDGDDEPWQRFARVTHPDFADKRVRVAEVPGHVQVTLTPAATITGRVTKKEADEVPVPAEDVEVSILPVPFTGDFPPRLTRSDEDGKYHFGSLPAGGYAIQARTTDWVSSGISYIEVTEGKQVLAPEIEMTRGGRVRVQLISDATGEPLNFDKPTRGYVGPKRLPQSEHPYGRPQEVEFSSEGVGEFQLTPGEYVFLANVEREDERWYSVEYSQITGPESFDEFPRHDVKEGELLEITVRVQQQ